MLLLICYISQIMTKNTRKPSGSDNIDNTVFTCLPISAL